MTPTITDLDWVTIKTTLPVFPYPPLSSRSPFRTSRLLCRPPTPDDLEDYHHLRTQPEVMQWTGQGKVDPNLEHTKRILFDRFGDGEGLYFDWAICEAETGEFLGVGGSHGRVGELGWPVLGYMLKPSAWGKGYATEFLQGFLELWWSLPREVAEFKVERDLVFGAGEEVLSAITNRTNGGSKRVLEKCGLQLVKVFVDPIHPHMKRPGQGLLKEEEKAKGPNGELNVIHGWVARRPAAGHIRAVESKDS